MRHIKSEFREEQQLKENMKKRGKERKMMEQKIHT